MTSEHKKAEIPQTIERLDSKPHPIETPAALSHEEKIEVPSSNKRKSSSDYTSSMRKKNFIRACELVSQRAYFNYAERFQLIYMPVCIDRKSCIHSSTKPPVIKEIPMKIATLMKLEIEAGQWHGALEVCIMSITPTQYLSEVVLKDVVEIILNTHEDPSSGYTVSQVIDKCKLVLSLQFTTHCPCVNAEICNMYTKFLTSMPKKENTQTNRTQFGSDKGIVSFCLQRLEYELGPDSSDGPLLDRVESTPEELRGTIRGMFYQKEQFEIFEMLDRNERIDRLMEVLHSLIELLQADIAVWQSSRNYDTRRQRRQLLMSSLLKSKDYSVSEGIIKIFSHFIHLEYPEPHIKTMTLWLNILMETFYSNEHNSNINFPSPGGSCKGIINPFYDIISKLPQKSILSILERIKPAFIRHQVGLLYSNDLLKSHENEVLTLVTKFLEESKWKDFPEDGNNTIVLKTLNVKRVKPSKLLKHLSMICKNSEMFVEYNDEKYSKLCPDTEDKEETISQRLVVYTLYVTVQSYLEAYGVQNIQDTLQKLNQELIEGSAENSSSCILNVESKYAVTDDFIKKYRYLFQMLKELVLKIKEIEAGNDTPEVVKIFNNLFN